MMSFTLNGFVIYPAKTSGDFIAIFQVSHIFLIPLRDVFGEYAKIAINQQEDSEKIKRVSGKEHGNHHKYKSCQKQESGKCIGTIAALHKTNQFVFQKYHLKMFSIFYSKKFPVKINEQGIKNH